MSEKTTNFINTIGVLARNEYLARDKWVLPSVCIAQAALESGWNLNAKTLFGIKGKGFTATTSEYYDGHYVQIQDSFRSYPNAASAVVGYYDFITGTPRYAGVVNNADYRDAVDKLIHTTDGLAYATSPTYIQNVISIIEQYGLTEWDAREQKTQPQESISYAHNVGDNVSYHTIYASSDSDNALSPLYNEGTITRIVAGARNPYLLIMELDGLTRSVLAAVLHLLYQQTSVLGIRFVFLRMKLMMVEVSEYIMMSTMSLK